jgi:hypothetical protein
MKIEITRTSKQDTAFDKTITFKREGQEYSVLLHWDNYAGYDLTFLGQVTPDWLDEWEKEYEENFEFMLDELTDKATEEGK